jgi:hypothetical protein
MEGPDEYKGIDWSIWPAEYNGEYYASRDMRLGKHRIVKTLILKKGSGKGRRPRRKK